VLSARRNAEHNGVENCHFRVGTASDIFSSISHFPAEQTVVVVDPPRCAGAKGVACLVMESCAPV
jgi:tRNA (uracil-5-)-methyltransferase